MAMAQAGCSGNAVAQHPAALQPLVLGFCFSSQCEAAAGDAVVWAGEALSGSWDSQ